MSNRFPELTYIPEYPDVDKIRAEYPGLTEWELEEICSTYLINDLDNFERAINSDIAYLNQGLIFHQADVHLNEYDRSNYAMTVSIESKSEEYEDFTRDSQAYLLRNEFYYNTSHIPDGTNRETRRAFAAYEKEIDTITDWIERMLIKYPGLEIKEQPRISRVVPDLGLIGSRSRKLKKGIRNRRK